MKPAETELLSERLSRIYSAATAVLALLSLFWVGTLLVMGWWNLAFVEIGLVVVCVATWLLLRRGMVSTALIGSQLTFYAVILIIALVYDVPNAAAPRVTHLFLIALGLFGYINYIRVPSRLQLGMIALSVVSFIVFASTEVRIPTATPLPDDVRVVGSWINVIAATAITAGCLYAMQAELSRKSTLVRELQQAFSRRQFELFYQPQVDRDGRAIGAEALLRWHHPKRGYISPLQFIPTAEQNGLMTVIGGWVILEACRTLAQWQKDPTTRHLVLAVNVSAGQFLDPDFENFVLTATRGAGVGEGRLKLELTESVMVANAELVAAKMTALHKAGIGSSLDDFGTGYSSLSSLKKLPLEQLKIDRSFVSDMLDNQRSAALAKSIIQMGNDLSLSVLAEGVETLEQFTFLRAAGCSQFQGYYFGKPVPLADFAKSLVPKAGLKTA